MCDKMDDDKEVKEKLESLRKYIPFLQCLITKLKAKKGNQHDQLLIKMETLYGLISNENKKLSMETLKKCEQSLTSLYGKVCEKKSAPKTDNSEKEVLNRARNASKNQESVGADKNKYNNIELGVTRVVSETDKNENHHNKSVIESNSNKIAITNTKLSCSFQGNSQSCAPTVNNKPVVDDQLKTIIKTTSSSSQAEKLEIDSLSFTQSTSNNITLSTISVRNIKQEIDETGNFPTKPESTLLLYQGKRNFELKELNTCKKTKLVENLNQNTANKNLPEECTPIENHFTEQNSILQGKSDIGLKRKLNDYNENNTSSSEHKKSKNENTTCKETLFEQNIDNRSTKENIDNSSLSSCDLPDKYSENVSRKLYIAKLQDNKAITGQVLGGVLNNVSDSNVVQDSIEKIFKKTNSNNNDSEIQTNIILERDINNISHTVNNSVDNKPLVTKSGSDSLQSNPGDSYRRQEIVSEENVSNSEVKETEVEDNKLIIDKFQDDTKTKECLNNDINGEIATEVSKTNSFFKMKSFRNVKPKDMQNNKLFYIKWTNFQKFKGKRRKSSGDITLKYSTQCTQESIDDFYLENFDIKRDNVPESFLPVIRVKRVKIDEYKESILKIPMAIQKNRDIFVPDNKTIKNTNPDIHVGDVDNYLMKCVLCTYEGRCLANHYARQHPMSEVLISRLTSDIIRNLKKNIGNKPEGKLKGAYTLICQFCYNKHTFPPIHWAIHYSTHTGEYQFQCTTCKRLASRKSKITDHMKTCSNPNIIRLRNPVNHSKDISAYTCDLCNYIQLDKNALKKHLIEQHEINADLFSKVVLIYFDDFEQQKSESCRSSVDEDILRIKNELDEEISINDNDDNESNSILGLDEKIGNDDLLVVQRYIEIDDVRAASPSMKKNKNKLNSKNSHTSTEARKKVTQNNQFAIISEKDISGSKNIINSTLSKSVSPSTEGNNEASTSMGKNNATESDLLACAGTSNSTAKTTDNKTLITLLNSKEKDPAENVPQIQNAHNQFKKDTPPASGVPLNILSSVALRTRKPSAKLLDMERENVVDLTSNGDDGIRKDNISNIQEIKQNRNTKIKRINNLGFSQEEFYKITYYCLVDGCKFANEHTENLHDHFEKKHSCVTWDGFCYTCARYTLSRKSPTLITEFKHLLEYHKPILVANKPDTNDTEHNIIELNDNGEKNSVSNNGNENEAKPLLKIRRLPGDTLSSAKEIELTQQAALVAANVTPKAVNMLSTNDAEKIKRIQPTGASSVPPGSVPPLKLFAESPNKLKTVNLENTVPSTKDKELQQIQIVDKSQEQQNDANKHELIISQVFGNVQNADINPQRLNSVIVLAKPTESQVKSNEDTSSSGFLKIQNVVSLSSKTQESDAINDRTVADQLKPWSKTTSMKNQNVIKKLLRDVCLFSLYKCMGDDCPFTTHSKNKMLEHIQYHELVSQHVTSETLESHFECAYCHVNAAERNALVSHIETEHIQDIYQCPYCFYRSCSEQNVLTHLATYHYQENRTIFVCFGTPKCLEYETINIMTSLKTNLRTMNCYKCKTSFIIVKNYIEHMLGEHSNNDGCIKCGMCYNAKFFSEPLMANHLTTIHKTAYYECVYCSFATNSLGDMPLHLADDHCSQLPYIGVRKPRYEYLPPNENETIANSTMLTCVVKSFDIKIYNDCPYTEEQLSSEDIDQNPPVPFHGQPTEKSLNSDIVVQKSSDLQISHVQSMLPNSDPANSTSTQSSSTASSKTVLECTDLTVEPTLGSVPVSATQTAAKSIGNIGSGFGGHNKSIIQVPLNTVSSTPQIKSAPHALKSSEIETIEKLLKKIVIGTGFEDDELYRCGVAGCTVSSLNVVAFYLHVMDHSKKLSSYKCYHCKTELSTIAYLRRHLDEHSSHRYFCYFCEVTGPSEEVVRNHCINIHQIRNVVTRPVVPNRENHKRDFFIVNDRDMNYTLQDIQKMWARKMSKTNRLFSPEDINKISKDLILNYEIYCSICRYGTKSQGDLMCHLLDHKTVTDKGTSDKPTEKKKVDPLTRLTSELNIPIYVPKLQRFVCGIQNCLHKATNATKMKDHIETHKSDQSYNCPHCNEVICQNQVNTDLIVEHLKLHAVNLWQCSECNNCFHSKDAIESHIPLTHPYTLVSLITYVRTDVKTVKINENTYNDGKTLKIIKFGLLEADKHIYNLCASKKDDTRANQNSPAHQTSTQINQTKDKVACTAESVENPPSIKKTLLTEESNIINGQLSTQKSQNPIIYQVQDVKKYTTDGKDTTNAKNSINNESEPITITLDDDDDDYNNDSMSFVKEKVGNNSEKDTV